MKIVFILTLTLLKINSALAWGDLGHQIVGAVAEERMQAETKDFVRGILGIEPVAVAANWPDHVRDDARFSSRDSDFAPFHFSEIPTGFTFANRPNKDPKDAYGAIVGASKILIQANESTPEEKLIALRYLIHIVGDIHQPLHVGNGYDRGGNECRIKLNEKSKPLNFHSFWDTELVLKLGETYKADNNTKPLSYYPQFISAMKAKATDKFNASKITLNTSDDISFSKDLGQRVSGWLDSSAQLRESIYPDNLNGDPQAYRKRSYCRWYSDQTKGTLGESSATTLADSDAQVLPTDYVTKNVKSVIESQLITGGIRLASLLDAIAIRAKANSDKLHLVTDEQQNLILKKLLEEMQN